MDPSAVADVQNPCPAISNAGKSRTFLATSWLKLSLVFRCPIAFAVIESPTNFHASMLACASCRSHWMARYAFWGAVFLAFAVQRKRSQVAPSRCSRSAPELRVLPFLETRVTQPSDGGRPPPGPG